jgi:hypothetical protein
VEPAGIRSGEFSGDVRGEGDCVVSKLGAGAGSLVCSTIGSGVAERPCPMQLVRLNVSKMPSGRATERFRIASFIFKVNIYVRMLDTA